MFIEVIEKSGRNIINTSKIICVSEQTYTIYLEGGFEIVLLKDDYQRLKTQLIEPNVT